MINLRIHVLAINLRLIFNIQDIRVKKRKIGSTLPMLPYQEHFLPGPKTLFLDRYYFHRRHCVCVCVCLSVCESLPRLSQKVLDRFQWNLAGWFIMIKDRFLSKMGWIGSIERIPRPFQMLKLPYHTKLLGNFLKAL